MEHTPIIKALEEAGVEIDTTDIARKKASRDTSIFERVPQAVVYPKNAEDLSMMVREVALAKKRGEDTSITARSAGTDMSGGPLTTGIVADMTKHMNHMGDVVSKGDEGYAYAEPGLYYRDFERATLQKGLLLPSYPASREICAMGGIVANNSGGERTLRYGKTETYIEELEIVLSDGSQALFKELSRGEVERKKAQDTLEGSIYRDMDTLLSEHAQIIAMHHPHVSKNSAGYALWDVRNPETGAVNLAKLICGSQGTLALWTKAKLRVIKTKEHRAMLVIFLHDIAKLPEIVTRVLAHKPESFESYDDHTFTLAVKFLPQMLAQMGWAKAAQLGLSFLPEAEMVITGGVPKMVLMAEFAEDSIEEADNRARAAQVSLADLGLKTKIEKDEKESEKYWIVRRESFNLLRKNVHGLYACPFIDDFVVPPETYPTFLPKLDALLEKYKDTFIYTIAGHIGNGNFHIIPLMDLSKESSRNTILELAPQVYELVIAYGGTTTGEHNDGIIRTPYLPMLFGNEMMQLFEETKRMFDPQNLFNPGKKVGGSFLDIERDMITVNP